LRVFLVLEAHIDVANEICSTQFVSINVAQWRFNKKKYG
jgi:hypothetical protein